MAIRFSLPRIGRRARREPREQRSLLPPGIAGAALTGRDTYLEHIGSLDQNAVVAMALQWLAGAIADSDAGPQPYVRLGDGTADYEHEAVGLLTDSAGIGWPAAASLIVRALLTSGTAYVLKLRDGQGRVQALQPLGVHAEPVLSRTRRRGVSPLLEAVRVHVAGMAYTLAREDLVIIRRTASPVVPELGQSPLAGVLREIAIDNVAAERNACALVNGAAASAIVAPRDETLDDPATLQRVAEALQRRMTGVNTGAIVPLPFPVELREFGASLDELLIFNARQDAAARICGALGIDPMVLGLPSSSKTYSNYGEAFRAAYEHAVAPTLAAIANGLTRDLLQELGGGEFGFDLSAVTALQDDHLGRAAAVTSLYVSGLITRREARSELGYSTDPAPGDDTLLPLPTDEDDEDEGELRHLRAQAAGPVRAAILQRQMHRLRERLAARAARLARDCAEGRIPTERFDNEMKGLLEEAHARASRLGRLLAGDTNTDLTLGDLRRGQSIADQEGLFLRHWATDAEWWANADEAQAAARARLYAARLRGTANDAWLNGGPTNARYRWVLNEALENCEDCMYYAGLGWIPRELLPTVPGRNDTPCLFNCGCRLERDDGTEGFRP